MGTYQHKESYKHLLAKQLLTSWLRELDEKQDFCSFGDLYWRSNWGVHEELPFYTTSDPFYFENSKGLIHYENLKTKHYKHQECFEKDAIRGSLLFVPDITIFHKGSPNILIEVIHKSPPTDEKMSKIYHFFKSKGCVPNVFIISADHILGQIEKPKSLNFELILSE